LARSEVKLVECGIKIVIPFLWKLEETVEALEHLVDTGFLARDDKIRRLSNIGLIIKGAIKKCKLYIYEQHILAFLSC
jgi:hypothetical protein